MRVIRFGYSKPIFLLLLMVLLLTLDNARADIADCMTTSQCDREAGECCARMMVSDTAGNYLDSHFCLQR